MKYTLKHRRPIVYISLVIYSLLSAFIILEACIPGGFSNIQSNFFAKIGAEIVNFFNGPQTPESIAPIGFGTVSDSSYLGQDENGYSNIAKGTTTLISIPINYPEDKDNYDVYNHEYSLEYVKGNKDNYNLVLSSRDLTSTTYVIDMRVVANEADEELYQINVNVAETLTYEYKFHIVDLVAPINYECRIDKTSLKIGETTSISTKLLDDNRDDPYLRRYIDERKLNRGTSNPSVASIDEYGVIHALSAGNSVITYGKYTYTINVSDEQIVKPNNNGLSLRISEDSNLNPYLLDYDYVFDGDNNPNDYSCLIFGDFINDELEDRSLSFRLDDELSAKLAPYKYDEDGYPIYKDELGRSCIRVCGYRKKANIILSCFSNADSTVFASLSLTTSEALPESMNLNYSGTVSKAMNEQLVIKGEFGPKNVNNKNIRVTVDNEEMVTILNNNSSSVTLTGNKIGSVHVSVTSLANESLKAEFDLNITAKDTIDDDNYSDFHSFIRKAAGHFFLFLVTAIFGFIFFYTFFDEQKKVWLAIIISLAGGLFTAGISELIQLFVPSRGGSVKDVGIDFLGYVIGTFITFGIIAFIKIIKMKKENNNIK